MFQDILGKAGLKIGHGTLFLPVPEESIGEMLLIWICGVIDGRLEKLILGGIWNAELSLSKWKKLLS